MLGMQLATWFGWAAIIALFFLVPIAGFAGSEVVRCGKREGAVDAETLTLTDRRAPILYVRSFIDDGSLGYVSGGDGQGLEYSTDEDRLVEGLSPLGPVIAIGKPGEALPQVGAARQYFQEDQWRSEVTRLMKRAQLVVLRCGTSEGILWELQNIMRLVPPERLLIWLPAKPDRQKQWSAFLDATKGYFPNRLPLKLDDSLLLSFTRDWTPHPIRHLSTSSAIFD
jgi:hypothetical protein